MSARHSRARSSIVAVALAWSAGGVMAARDAAAQVEAAADAPADTAQDAFRRGNDHAKAKRWAEALAAYEEAYRLRPAWDIAGNLGIAELELGRPRKAAAHLDEALRGFPGSGKPEQRRLLDEALARAASSVGRLTIRTSVAGSTVTVDGVVVGVSPLSGPVFVDPGRHLVEVQRGDARGSEAIEVAAGSAKDVLVTESASSGAPSKPPPMVDEGRPTWPAIVLGGVGVVGVGVGIGLVVAANGASSDAEARVRDAADAGAPCRGGETTGFCAEAADLLADRDGYATGSIIGFAVGGAAAIGAVTYLLWPVDDADPASASVAPLLGPDLWGARTSISF